VARSMYGDRVDGSLREYMRIKGETYLRKLVNEGLVGTVIGVVGKVHRIDVEALTSFGKMYARGRYLLLPERIIEYAGEIVPVSAIFDGSIDFRSQHAYCYAYSITWVGWHRMYYHSMLFEDTLRTEHIVKECSL